MNISPNHGRYLAFLARQISEICLEMIHHPWLNLDNLSSAPSNKRHRVREWKKRNTIGDLKWVTLVRIYDWTIYNIHNII